MIFHNPPIIWHLDLDLLQLNVMIFLNLDLSSISGDALFSDEAA